MTGEIPEDWRMTDVVPIHKGRSRDDKNNYRLTCLLLTLERSIPGAITKHLIRNDSLGQNQRGFVSGKLCLAKLLSLLTDMIVRMERGDPVQLEGHGRG